MNRHRNFYANLAETLKEEEGYDDDDNYDDYNDEEYYDENYDEEYEGGFTEEFVGEEIKVISTTETSTANGTVGSDVKERSKIVKTNSSPYSFIFPESDEDYEILAAMIPQLDQMWKSISGVPLSEKEAVAGLRLHQYDPDATAAYLKKEMEEKKKMRGNRPRVLHASTEVKKNQTESDVQNVSSKEATLTPFLANDAQQMNNKASLETRRPTVEIQTSFTSHQPSFPFSSGCSPLKKESVMDCTLIVAGHVDAGKSTILGHLLVLLGRVSVSSPFSKPNGKSMNLPHSPNGAPCYAHVFDQTEEERQRGMTMDVGTHNFETPHRRFHVLDAPGHKDYIVSMMSGATQADAVLLIVTATLGEFEVGLNHGTKEHLEILKILGVKKAIVAVNKMDMVGYSQERYNEVAHKVRELFSKLQFPESCVAGVCPISGKTGTNMISNCDGREEMPWYLGPSLLDLLDSCPLESRSIKGPLRISLQDLNDVHLYVKIENGLLKKGDKVQFVPCGTVVIVKNITKHGGSESIAEAVAGEQVILKLATTPVGIYAGCIGCHSTNLISASTDFEAYIQTIEMLERPLLPGSSLLLIAHALQVNIRILRLVSIFDSSNGEGKWSTGMVKCITKDREAKIVFRAETKVALEPADCCQSLSRIVLSQDGNTVAGGRILKALSCP